MVFRHAFSLSLILACMWSEGVLSFSSPTSRRTMASTLTTSSSSKRSNGIMPAQPLLLPSEIQCHTAAMLSIRPPLKRTQLAMSTDDSSSEKEATKEQEDGSEATNAQNQNVIMMVPLFCKLMVVLMIKFLKDLVVFPSLFVWKLAIKSKEKIVGWFDKVSFGTTASTFKPNGSAK